MGALPEPGPKQPSALREAFHRLAKERTGLPEKIGTAPDSSALLRASFLRVAAERRAAARRTPPVQPPTGPQELKAAPPPVVPVANGMGPQEILTPQEIDNLLASLPYVEPPSSAAAVSPLVEPALSQAGEPLSLEAAQRIRTLIAGIQTEKDPVKQQLMIEALSQSLQIDPQSPHPLEAEETKALITKELLSFDAENLLNLLQKYSSLREALVMLRDRNVGEIENDSIYYPAASSQLNAAKILQVLEREQARIDEINRSLSADELPPQILTQAEIKRVLESLPEDLSLDKGSGAETPTKLPPYVEEAAKVFNLTDKQKSDFFIHTADQYFRNPKFQEGTTVLARKRLEEILIEVAPKWDRIKKADALARKYRHGPPRIALPFVGSKESKELAKKYRGIFPTMQKIFPDFAINDRSWCAWQLSAVLEKPIQEYSEGELHAVIGAIDTLFYCKRWIASPE